jgi:hypothetical protein
VPSIFVPPSTNDTWTITTFLGELLDRAETLYGPRVIDCTLLGVQMGLTDQPALMHLKGNMWYISLRCSVGSSREEAIFDVSHEVIHFLAPVPKANALEEGLAVHFSLKHGCDSVPQLSKARNQLPLPYQNALAVYEEFVANGGDIKTLRQHEPYISKASRELIKHCAPKCDDKLISKLLGLIDDL